MLRRPLTILVALLSSACTGTITFGIDSIRDGGSSDVEPPADAAPDAAPDADTPDIGDVDGGCRAVAPSFPSSWPFKSTSMAYVDEFHSKVLNCSPPQCHGVGAMGKPPLIPRLPAEIDPNLMRATSELWQRASYTPPAELNSSPLFHHARPEELPNSWLYDDTTVMRLREFVERGELCGWKPIVEAQRAGNFNCMGGEPPDAGEPDTGEVDAAVDDGGGGDAAADAGEAGEDAGDDAGVDAGGEPPDAGGGAVEICDCPAPVLDLSHCGP